MPPASRRSARSGPGAVRLRRTVPPTEAEPLPARQRFLENDAYRAAREWQRYEGTPQRDLFRVLRERFLGRHAGTAGWALDAGAGPGRFTPRLGAGPAERRVALDLGREMLLELRDRWSSGRTADAAPELLWADAGRPPFRAQAFANVAALGNLLGFAGADGDRLLTALTELVAPGGGILLEIAPGPGERSRYLARLPATSVGRLFRSAASLVAGRVEREGFLREPPRKSSAGEFVRVDPTRLAGELARRGFEVREVLTVAPALGADPARVAAVARDPKAWAHLLEVEERLGRTERRWPDAAAVLLAAVRSGSGVPAAESEG